MRIRKIEAMIVVVLSVVFLLSAFTGISEAKSRIQILPSEETSASMMDVKSIEGFYDRLEDAMVTEDLEALLTLYSDDYNHNYVTKAQIENLWRDIFDRFDNLYSSHIFSSVNVFDKEAALTCTGVIMGIPKGEDTHVIVDNWVAKNHYLSKVSGTWKIMGGATRWYTARKDLPGDKVEYKVEFHPFF